MKPLWEQIADEWLDSGYGNGYVDGHTFWWAPELPKLPILAHPPKPVHKTNPKEFWEHQKDLGNA